MANNKTKQTISLDYVLIKGTQLESSYGAILPKDKIDARIKRATMKPELTTEQLIEVARLYNEAYISLEQGLSALFGESDTFECLYEDLEERIGTGISCLITELTYQTHPEYIVITKQ